MTFLTTIGKTLVRHDEVLFWFPCSETSGTIIRDAVRGIEIAPADVGDGSIDFSIPNAVTILNNTSSLATPLHSGTWPLLDLSKVIINAAIIKTVNGGLVKIPIGADNDNDINKLSLSFANIMHCIMVSDTDHSIYSTFGNKTLANNTDYIIWEIWDGPDNTLSCGALNHDGTVAQSSTSPNADLVGSITDAETMLGISSIQPTNATRVNNIHCYGWGLWQFDVVPSNFYGWLAIIAAQCVAGNKTPWAVA